MLGCELCLVCTYIFMEGSNADNVIIILNPNNNSSLLFFLSSQSCKADLVKDNGHKYFLSVLADPYMPVSAANKKLVCDRVEYRRQA